MQVGSKVSLNIDPCDIHIVGDKTSSDPTWFEPKWRFVRTNQDTWNYYSSRYSKGVRLTQVAGRWNTQKIPEKYFLVSFQLIMVIYHHISSYANFLNLIIFSWTFEKIFSLSAARHRMIATVCVFVPWWYCSPNEWVEVKLPLTRKLVHRLQIRCNVINMIIIQMSELPSNRIYNLQSSSRAREMSRKWVQNVKQKIKLWEIIKWHREHDENHIFSNLSSHLCYCRYLNGPTIRYSRIYLNTYVTQLSWLDIAF